MNSPENITHHASQISAETVAGLNLGKILVPIDFSCRSKKSLQYAIQFAKKFGASIVLLHVLPPVPDEGVEYEDESRLRLKAWAYEFVPSGVPVQIEMSRGVETIEILNQAKKLAADLMIISTHGRVGRAHALAGSLAERLVQLAPCPVLVIREQEHDFIETTKGEEACAPQDNWGTAVQKDLSPDFLGGNI